MDPSDDAAGRKAAVKCTSAVKPSPDPDNSGSAAMETTEVDRISSLTDDILAKILSSVDSSSSADAVRTCVLSRRWRPLWKLLPELRLPFFPGPDMASKFGAALDGHQVPLRHLQVEGHGKGARPRYLATWLPAAARRVSGRFALLVDACDDERDDDEIDALTFEDRLEELADFELPCFDQATSISICLGFFGRLAMPPPPAAATAGGGGVVFSRLTDLTLESVSFHDSSELGDAVSSARCPCLQTLKLCNTRGIHVLAVSSTSLLKMTLDRVTGLLELAVEAPELRELTMVACFLFALMMAGSIAVSIAAPQLVSLYWRDMDGQRDVVALLGNFPLLRSLGCFGLDVYALEQSAGAYNRALLEVLQGIQFLENLTLMMGYGTNLDNYQFLMEDMKTLPQVKTLNLSVISRGHSIGGSLFHTLRICIGIRKLVLELRPSSTYEEPWPCPSGCICEQQSNWQSEKLLLVCLKEVEIQRFGRYIRDLDLVERLFGWATSLTKATIIFDVSVTKGMVEEMSRMIELFSRPEIHIDFQVS